MNEETSTNPIDEAAQAAEDAAKAAGGSSAADTDKIMNELSQLGHKVAAAVQSVWESEERHKAEEEIRKALKMAGDSIDHVAESVRKSDVTKDVQGQATRAAEAVQQNDVTKQLKQGLLAGLRRINEELSEFLDKSKVEEAVKSAGEAAAAAASAVVEEAADKVKDA